MVIQKEFPSGWWRMRWKFLPYCCSLKVTCTIVLLHNDAKQYSMHKESCSIATLKPASLVTVSHLIGSRWRLMGRFSSSLSWIWSSRRQISIQQSLFEDLHICWRPCCSLLKAYPSDKLKHRRLQDRHALMPHLMHTVSEDDVDYVRRSPLTLEVWSPHTT